MTSLRRPTRWDFILSVNLIRLQVGAQFQVAGREDESDEGSEEDETEVLECPLRTVFMLKRRKSEDCIFDFFSCQLEHYVSLFIEYNVTMLQ